MRCGRWPRGLLRSCPPGPSPGWAPPRSAAGVYGMLRVRRTPLRSGPSRRSAARCITATRSQTWRTTDRSWETKTRVRATLVDEVGEQVEHLCADGDVERADRLVGDEDPRPAPAPGRSRSAAAVRRRTGGGTGRPRRPAVPRPRAAPRPVPAGCGAGPGRPAARPRCRRTRIRGSSEPIGSWKTSWRRSRRKPSRRSGSRAIVTALDHHRSARGPVETGEDPQQGRLAATRLPDEAEVLAVGDVEADPAQRVHRRAGVQQGAARPAVVSGSRRGR